MTSSTESLRHMLDERGVEWEDHSDEKHKRTDWDNGSCWFIEYEDGWTQWGMSKPVTPEQAIAATLGAKTCEMNVLDTGNEAAYEHYEYIMHCNGCGHEFGHVLYNEDGDVWMSERPNYCPNCGKRCIG